MDLRTLVVLCSVFAAVNSANYTYLQYKFNRNYLGFNNYDVEWTSPGIYKLSSSVTQYLGFRNLLTSITISVPESQIDPYYQNIIFNTTLNMCDLLNSVLTNFAMKIFLANIERFSDYKLICPFRSGKFEVVNYPGVDAIIPKLLEPFVVPSKFRMIISIDADVLGKRKLIRVAYMKAEGVNTGLAGIFG